MDDGKGNLYLSGSYFIDNFETYTNNRDNVYNPGLIGLGKYIVDGEFNTCE